MKIFNLIILFFCFYSLVGQSETIYLKDTTLNTFCRFHKEVDSTIVQEGVKYEYFSISSTDLIFSLKNYKDIRIRMKTTKNGTTIKQYISNENESCWASAFNNNLEYKLLFQDSMNPLKNFYSRFKIERREDEIILSTKEAFFGQIKILDSRINFIVRPYMIFKSNVKLMETQNQITTLEFGEPFKLFNKHYKLNELDLSSRSIILNSVTFQESQIGYKEGKLISNFEEVKNRLNTNLLGDRKMNNSEYYIFYFWGEWCQPCLKKIDDNKTLFLRLDLNKVNLINIALSMTNESELKTIALIQRKQINGFHIIENQKSFSNGLIQKLNINTYPSFVILNSQGKIVFRTDNNKKGTIEYFLKKNKLLKSQNEN